jgi:hypothetical protein
VKEKGEVYYAEKKRKGSPSGLERLNQRSDLVWGFYPFSPVLC